MGVESWGTGLGSAWAAYRLLELGLVLLVVGVAVRTVRRARREARAETLHSARVAGLARTATAHDEEQWAEVRHDAANSLAGIRSALRILQDRAGTGSEALSGALERELDHLDQLLRGTPGATVDFPMDELVEDTALLSRVQGMDVTVRARPALARGRPGDVRRAVENLLANARRHGGRAVQVDVRRGTGGVEVAVSDDGPGIPEALSTTLFDRGSRDGSAAGSGLGLHVSRKLLRDQLGDLSVRAGGGATFTLRLPEPSATAHADASPLCRGSR